MYQIPGDACARDFVVACLSTGVAFAGDAVVWPEVFADWVEHVVKAAAQAVVAMASGFQSHDAVAYPRPVLVTDHFP